MIVSTPMGKLGFEAISNRFTHGPFMAKPTCAPIEHRTVATNGNSYHWVNQCPIAVFSVVAITAVDRAVEL